MTPPTNPPTPRRYWAVTDVQTGEYVLNPWQKVPVLHADFVPEESRRPDEQHVTLTESVVIPAASYTRLLAIEAAYETLKAAARNAMDNSWHIDTPHPDCVCHDWRGCTVLDDKDNAELREALK